LIAAASANRKPAFKNRTTELDFSSAGRNASKGNTWSVISMTELSERKEEEGPSLLLPDKGEKGLPRDRTVDQWL
jgi:hypothetical protein